MKKILSVVNDKFSIKLILKKLSFIFKHLNITSKKCKRVIIKYEKFLNLLTEKRKTFIELIKKKNNFIIKLCVLTKRVFKNLLIQIQEDIL